MFCLKVDDYSFILSHLKSINRKKLGPLSDFTFYIF